MAAAGEEKEAALFGEMTLSLDPASSTTWMPAACVQLDGKVAHECFNLRVGPNYAKNKKKAQSESCIYEVFKVSFHRTEKKQWHMAEHTDLPSVLPNKKGFLLQLPPLLIIHCMVPDYKAKAIGKSVTDGPGASLVLYCRLTADARELLDGMDAGALPPAYHLLYAYTQGKMGIFKGVPRVVNLKESGLNKALSSLVESYNAKPFLAWKTSQQFKGEGYFEVDVDVHSWSLICRKGLWNLRGDIPNLVLDVGFTIEADDDANLPERLVTCVRLNRLDLTKAIEGFSKR